MAEVTFVGWIQPVDVKRAHGIVPRSPQDDQRLSLVCRGLNQTVAEWRPDLVEPTVTVPDGTSDDYSPAFDTVPGETRTDWNDRISLGLTKLAHAWYTGLGTGVIPDQYDGYVGPPPMMTRDVEQLLEVGRGYRPVIA